ncbi:tyrosine-type recombinase/integrase [Thermoproteota archaeon]
MGDIDRFFTAENVEPQKIWDQWKEQNAGKSTPISYQIGIDYFLEYHEIDDLNELYRLQLEALKRGRTDPSKLYLVHNMVIDCVMHRINVKKQSGQYAKSTKAAVTKFMHLVGFKDFNVKLDMGILRKNTGDGSDIISPIELRTVIEIAADDLMKKALILILKDSGLRIGDALGLNIGDVIEALDNRYIDFFYLKKFTQKTSSRAQTVLGYESLNALRNWVKYRKQKGEALTDDHPIFIPYRLKDVEDDIKAKRNPKLNQKIRGKLRLTAASGSSVVSRIFSKAGYPKVTAHGLRKLHSTYLSLGEDKMDETKISRLEGRDIGDSRESYKIYPEKELVEEYKRAYHMLSLEDKPHSKEIEKLRGDNMAMQKQLDDMQNQIRELLTQPRTPWGKVTSNGKLDL